MRNATELHRPAFLMNVPFGYTASEPNNVWMEEYEDADRVVDQRKAMAQFLDLYNLIASEGLVYLLPTPQDQPLQDLVFTANLGIVLGDNQMVISNFPPGPRYGETAVGKAFFESMGYDTVVSPYLFEGEAELKHLRDNVYIGGYGQRSTIEAYEWMESEYGIQVVKLAMKDPALYHLDCSVFPLTKDKTLLCRALYSDDELAEVDAVTEVIDVSTEHAMAGICNSIRLGNTIVNGSHLYELSPQSSDYKAERSKNRALEDIAEDLAFEVNFVQISEYHKAGALLSCMVMHLNHESYEIELL